MGRLVVTEFITLDGVVEAPGGEPGHPHSGWVGEFFDPGWEEYKLEETLAADSLLLGRVTYEGFAAAWPQRGGPFAEKMNAMPKHVVTSRPRELEWTNSTALEGDVATSVAELKRTGPGEVLVAGSRTLVGALIEHDLVDELRLMVFPVVLGSGFRLFPERPEKLVLELVESRGFGSGVQLLAYRPAADAARSRL